MDCRTAFRPGAAIHAMNDKCRSHKCSELRLRARMLFHGHKKAPAFLLGALSFNSES